MWEWINANWVYFAIGVGCYMLGNLNGQGKVRMEWMMNEAQRNQQSIYGDYLSSISKEDLNV